MKIIIMLSLVLLSFGNISYANKNLLEIERLHQIKAYLSDLQDHDADAISGLFVPGGTVLSTSRGSINAAQFFHSFLPTIKIATVSVQSIYKAVDKKNDYSASFSFHWILKDGTKDGAVYEDEFIFEKNSALFKQVIMYENTHGL
jgi:hypothetical protein